MTDKDTKEEEAHDEDFYDDYNENDNYLIDKALGNIKDDPGSVRSRPRRIPIYKIQLSDEDKIPKMPENILQEPKDEEYQKKIDELKKKNNEKRASIDEYIEKRKQETMGVESETWIGINNKSKLDRPILKYQKKVGILWEEDILSMTNTYSKTNTDKLAENFQILRAFMGQVSYLVRKIGVKVIFTSDMLMKAIIRKLIHWEVNRIIWSTKYYTRNYGYGKIEIEKDCNEDPQISSLS